MWFFRLFLIFFFTAYIFGCAEKTTFSGKIITEEDLSNIKLLDKDDLIRRFGPPSYIDNILNNYFYFTEKRKVKNFYNSKIEYSYLFVFQIDNKNKIIKQEAINLLTENKHKYKNKETQNNIIKRGLIEKVFGGIGANQFPSSPN
ncbi:MAG: hypothetical protein HOI06_05720 [Pelagibacteraceae bacterium]|nr:hypothetical protein [Pelagibacteraceae bacterium]